MDYEAALEALAAPKRLKTELPPPYVFEKCGVRVELVDGRLTCLCPFHPDSTPSVYMIEGEHGWRWGCWSCGLSGDVIDLIRQFRPEYGFSKAVEVGKALVVQLRSEGWKAPVLESTRTWDPSWARMLVREAERNLDGVAEFVAAKGYPFGAGWLRDTFGVGSLNGRLIVPIRDQDRSLVGVKHRSTAGTDHLYAFPGSKLQDVFYEPQIGNAPGWSVILCEGESDCWVTTWMLEQAQRFYSVYATSAGASQPPKPARLLAGRSVDICFDGDAAGRQGAQRWAEELRRVGCDVTVWELPDGADLASIGGPKWLL